jgi:tetratricopeptide (TPR) repeat protein/DNA-binding MarR family transcriptional regulator
MDEYPVPGNIEIREYVSLARPKMKLKLTIEERILLHIRDYFKYEHNMQAPFALTQDGIAKAVSVVRSAIPRSMKKLEDKGFVKEQISHVEGVVRRRKIYYLTTEGLMRAQEIIEKLEQVKCTAKNQEGEEKELKLSELNKYLGTNFTFLEILEGVDEECMFDYSAFVAMKAKAEVEGEEPEGFIAMTEKAPKLAYFIGRDNELDTLKAWLEGPDRNIVVVHGIAGIGKTTMALRLMDEFRAKKHIIWYSFHDWDTLRYFIKSISSFLAKLGRRELQRMLDSEPVIDLNSFAEIFESDMKDLDVLLIVDDLHKARKDILPIFTLFTEVMERLDRTKLLIFSRNIVPFYDRRHVKVKKLVGELHLTGLSKEAASELMEHRGLKPADLDMIYKFTGGHPLSLELLEHGAGSRKVAGIDDLNMYIQEEIFSRVPASERKLLAYASVYRHGAPRDILLEESEGGLDTIQDLTARTFLTVNEGIYSVHDLISEFFYESQPPAKRKNFHGKAADYYLKIIKELIGDGDTTYSLQSEPEGALGTALLEGLYHLIYSERFKDAGKFASDQGDRLMTLDMSEELEELLEELPLDTLDDNTRAVVLLCLGETGNHHRNFDKAMDYYTRSLETFRLIHGEATEPARLALIYRRLGFIFERKNDRDKALSHHEKSLELAEKAGDNLAASEAYGALGWLHWSVGDHDKANEFYDNCINMAENIADMPGKAKVYLGICMGLAKRGELEEALKYYEKCLDILERNEDIFKLARSYEGMGDHYLRSIFASFLKQSKSD